MKTSLRFATLATLLGLASPGAVLAQTDHDAHHPNGAATTEAAAQYAEGTVKKVDKAAGKITIAHGPLESLKMPAMTMVFRAGDPGMLEQVKAGDKVRFTVDRSGGALTVTSLEVTP